MRNARQSNATGNVIKNMRQYNATDDGMTKRANTNNNKCDEKESAQIRETFLRQEVLIS